MKGRIAAVVGLCLWLTSTLPGNLPGALAFETGPKKDGEKEKQKARRPVLDYQKAGRTRKVDVQMAEKRKVIRDQLQQLLKFEKDDKERPSLLFRLAENYFSEAEAYFNQAQELDDDLTKDPTNEALRKQVEEGKKGLRVTEREWRLRAIEQYQAIAKEYPTYPGRDQVLFYLGLSLWDVEQHKEALAVYKEMIATYPDSKFVPDAYLAFGDYYFDKAKLEKALMAYKKVTEYTESEVYPYALYKQGWCYYNLHEWEKAKDMFGSVVALTEMDPKIQLRKEALNDFTLTYGHEGSADDAPRIFKRMAAKEAHGLLINLAAMYFADGKDKKAVILYRYLIQVEKCSAEVPFYQGRIVDAASRVGDKRYTVGQVRSLVDKFKQVQECVKQPDARQVERIKEAQELAEITLRKLASTWYKEAKETKQKETFEYAQEMFSDYLGLFPESKDAYDMRFVFAELLFHRLGRFERAAAEYTKIVAQDLAFLKQHKKFPPPADPKKGGVAPPGTYFCDSAYKSMQANREILKKERRKEKKTSKAAAKKAEASGAKKSLDKQPIPKYKKRFIQSAEIFLDYCPKDEDILDVKYDIAKTYYDYYHLDEAIKRFDEIVKDFPDSDLANYAANLVIDALNEREDMDALDGAARKYYKNQKLMKNDKLRTYLEDLIPKIAFKRIAAMGEKLSKPPAGVQALSELQIHSKVAYGYIKFWREFPKHELADESLFNASVEYTQAERLDKARKARQLLIDQYPKSDLVPGTIFNLAENYERLADFDQAATLYERYADTYKKMKGLGKAVSYANEKKKGKRPGKRGRVKQVKKPKPKPKGDKAKLEKRFEGNRRTWNLEDAEVALLNAGIYREALHQYKQAIADRIEFIDLFPKSKDAAQVYYSLGLLYERLGQHPKAAEVFATYFERYLGGNLDRAIAAHMKRYMMLAKAKRPDHKAMDREVQTTLSLYNKHRKKQKKDDLAEAAEAAAHAAFILAEPVYQDYLKYRFTQSPKKGEKQQQDHLTKQLAEKLKRFKKVENVFTEVAKRKQAEWAIASLYKIGRAYEDLAQTLFKAPLPKGLTPEQIEIYKDQLRSLAQPFEDKAAAHFEAAVKKGSELGFYSRYTQLALAKLQHYRPAEYPREKLGFELGVVGDPASRNPLLLATWDEAMKRPELLDEKPLTTKREAEAEPAAQPAPEPKQVEPTGQAPEGGEPKQGDSDPADAEPAPPATREMADPAKDAMEKDEPIDEFD